MFKFNNGNGAVICDVCRIIIKDNITANESYEYASLDGNHYCEVHTKSHINVFSEPITISDIKRGDIFYEKGILGLWAKFIALEDGGNKSIADGIGREFVMESIVVKILDVSHGDYSRIGSIIKMENDPNLENNRGPRLFRKNTKSGDTSENSLQGDWRRIQ